jgi:sec-independent protein translocase protein TatC
MFILKKLFDVREKIHPGHEKSFFDHLEDLRRLITRMVITVVVSMLVAFIFHSQLLDLMRRPVDQLWEVQQENRLPDSSDGAARPVDLDLWERAKEVERAVAALEPEERVVFQETLADDNLVFHAQTVGMLRMAQALPVVDREKFIATMDEEGELRRQVEALLATDADTVIDPRGNIRLMSALRPTETFMLSMKLSFFAGLVLSLPLLMLYLLQFLLPARDQFRRRVIWPAIATGFGLFLGGASFAYFGVLPRALLFFSEWSGRLNVSNDWRIGEYISFALNFTLMFGAAFELPVVVMVLVKLGLIDHALMARTRSYSIVGIFILAAVLTPPDPFTLLVLALPLVVLYEICIWLAWFQNRRDARREAAA